MTEISFVMTESFAVVYDNPSSVNQNIADYVGEWWSDYIEDGSGDYTVNCNTRSTVVDDSALNDTGDLAERRYDIENWLEDNADWYYIPEAIHILDYYGGDDLTWGNAALPGAGDPGDKSALNDAFFEFEEGNGDPDDDHAQEYEPNAFEKVAAHECAHLFDAYHSDSSVFSNCEGTLMWEIGDPSDCSKACQDPDQKLRQPSTCAIDSIQNYMDTRL